MDKKNRREFLKLSLAGGAFALLSSHRLGHFIKDDEMVEIMEYASR